MKKRLLALLITLLMALSLVLSGCKSKTEEVTTDTTTVAPTKTDKVTPADEYPEIIPETTADTAATTSHGAAAPGAAGSSASSTTETNSTEVPEPAVPEAEKAYDMTAEAPTFDLSFADSEAGSSAADFGSYEVTTEAIERDYTMVKDSVEGASFEAMPGAAALDDIASAETDYYPEEYKESEIETEYMPVELHAGMLSAGEWNDNINFDFLQDLLNKSDGYVQSYQTYFEEWGLKPYSRIVVSCSDADGQPLERSKVVISDTEGNILSTAYTDNSGYAYCYYALTGGSTAGALTVTAISPNAAESFTATVEEQDISTSTLVPFVFNDSNRERSLDLMFMVDTTGSMGDEMYFLKAELEDVIKRVREANDNIPVRLSVNFYRDYGDDYVVRPYDFSTDIAQQLEYLSMERVAGGGDYEEAVDIALLNAIEEHEWNEDNIKLMFIVLDAPPHKTTEVLANLKKSVAKAEEKGIRIIPVASSGVDKSTEFLLRTLAMTTGGTYTFLTNDSGIGGSHIEPTIGEYTVEYLNNLLVRVINSYIGITDEVKPFVATQPVIEPIICDPIIIEDPDQGGFPITIQTNPNYPDAIVE